MANTPNPTLFLRNFVYVAIFAVGIFLGLYLKTNNTQNSVVKEDNFFSPTLREPIQQSNRLTNPLLECGDLNPLSENSAQAGRLDVVNYLEEQKKSGTISLAAVYYRDLNNGPWFGIEEKQLFIPGSLLKVPLMISLLKKSEEDKNLLSQEISFEGGDAQTPQIFTPSQKIEAGHKYTVDSLLDYMIKYSDNNAALLLSQILDDNFKNKSYYELGVRVPKSGDYEISVKNYATFLRVLYNSTYLNQTNSEKALDILTKTEFNNGLIAGLPPGIMVAHKFGERELDDQNQKQLHDCGIIYAPLKPYILCVMTRGPDIQKLPGLISQISKLVYQHIQE